MVKTSYIARDRLYTKLARKGYHVQAILRCVDELTPAEKDPVELFNLADVNDWIAANPKDTVNTTRK